MVINAFASTYDMMFVYLLDGTLIMIISSESSIVLIDLN